MEMRPRGSTGRSHQTDHLAFLNLIILIHQNLIEMKVHALNSAAMIDHKGDTREKLIRH
jgi:hypothetical protein